MPHKAVFLDRDGVINDNSVHVNKPSDLILYPWAAESIRRLRREGYLVFIVTNQGGIEMGYFTEHDLLAIHTHLESILNEENTYVDDIAFCPHFRSECECRKPKPGMILTLANKHNVDLSTSWMVGDFKTDIEAGISAGCHTIKIGEPVSEADFNCSSLAEAVDYIISITRE